TVQCDEGDPVETLGQNEFIGHLLLSSALRKPLSDYAVCLCCGFWLASPDMRDQIARAEIARGCYTSAGWENPREGHHHEKVCHGRRINHRGGAAARRNSRRSASRRAGRRPQMGPRLTGAAERRADGDPFRRSDERGTVRLSHKVP